jgi:hypothetical protein
MLWRAIDTPLHMGVFGWKRTFVVVLCYSAKYGADGNFPPLISDQLPATLEVM